MNTLEKIDEIDQIIHSPSRLKILIVLAEVVRQISPF